MKKDHEPGKTKLTKNTIGGRIFRIILGVALGLLFLFTTFSVLYVMRTSNTEKERIEDLSIHVVNEIISPMVDEKDQSVMNLAIGNATSINRFFDGCRNTAEMIASVAGRLYREDRPVEGNIVEPPTPDMIGEESVYRVDSERFDPENPEEKHALEVMSRLRHILRSIDAMDSDITSVYFASDEGFTLFADDQAGVVIDEYGSVIPFDAASRDWYKDAAAAGKAVCGSLTTDYYTNAPMMTISAPVYADDEKRNLIGVAAIDVSMGTVQEILDTSDSKIATACIVNSSGDLQISTSEEGLFGLEPNESANIYQDTNPVLEQAIDDASAGKTGYEQFYLKPDDTEISFEALANIVTAEVSEENKAGFGLLEDINAYKVYYAPIPVLDWSYLYVADTRPMTEKIYQILTDFTTKTDEQQAGRQTAMIIALVVILSTMVLVLVAVYLLSKRLSKTVTKPIVALTKKVQMLSGDKLDFTWDMKADDETQMLAESFEGMTEKIREYIRDLTTVTAEKERIGAELDVARKIQADMLPVEFPDREDFKLYASMTPAKEVGGDFYDFYMIDDDHMALVMADVSGKGVPAALFMVVSKILIKHRAMSGFAGPGDVFSAANHVLCERNEEMLFVTAWIGIVTLSTGEMICANAGHEYPIIRRAGGKFELFEDEHDIPLAAVDDTEFREYSMKLNPGDALFLYTDGFPESMNEAGEQFTEQRMLHAMNEEPFDDPKAMDEHIRLRVKEFVGGASQFDDMTALGFFYHGQPEKGQD